MFALKPNHIRTASFAGMLALGTLLLSGCTEEKAEAVETTRPVKVVEITEAAHARKLEYSGSVKSRTEMNLGFRVAGKITERLVNIGDRVKSGEVLSRIDPTDYALAVASQKASLVAQEKAVATADLANRRARTLYEKSALPKAQMEQAQLAYDQAEAARIAAASSLDQAKNQLSYAELRSDRDGIVTAINADRGQVVGIGTPVVTVVADDQKEVEVAVPENEISAFRTGEKVKASFWSDDNLVLDGTIREISGSADPQSRTFSVRVSLPDNENVLIGMTATVVADVETHNDAIAVPLSALSEKDGRKIVWTVDRSAETVHSRPVEVSSFTEDGVGITKGLSVGDVVVSAGTQFMAENMKVKLPKMIEQAATDLLN